MYLNWENRPNEDYYAIDIETDDLRATVVWVMCWRNLRTDETGACTTYEQMAQFFADRRGCTFVGHNILRFDVPVLNALVPNVDVDLTKCVDTLVLSTLYSPNIEGGHSLGAWGERLGVAKDDFNDFAGGLSDEMIDYCHKDVEVTAQLYRRLSAVMRRIPFSELSAKIQHRITCVLDKQSKNGFYFDGERALVLYQQLRRREGELQDEIRQAFPAKRVLVREAKAFTKTGKHSAIYLKDRDRYVTQLDDATGLYRAYEDVQFSIGSPKQRVEELTKLGWEPDERTPKGFPKVTEASLVAFAEESGIHEVGLISKWMSVNGRANMINTWIENWNENTHCIHGKLFVADTLRFRHQAPNTANIPAVRMDKQDNVLRGELGDFTYEARDLWCARPGRLLVGTDAAGLELRMLAHYLNREDFTDGVVNGDPHQTNADIVGITRPQAKTLIYAVCYGAGAKKIASSLKVSLKEGTRIRALFLERLGLEDLIGQCRAEQEAGRVWLVDGSGVICPSPHAALNYKLQGGGARVMALAACLLERDILRFGLDSLKVGDIHDEWQYDVAPEDADEHARLSVAAIQEAGRMLRLNVPLDGEAKKGRTWAETH